MLARYLIPFGAALLLVACQTQQVYEVERARSYAADKQAVWDRLLAYLERERITVTSADLARGSVEAERRDFEDQGWADCERRRVYQETGSGSRRMSWALRVDRDLALQVDVAGDTGATQVSLDARFTEEQINTASYRHFMQPCRSKGVLERALLDALGAPVAADPAQDAQTD